MPVLGLAEFIDDMKKAGRAVEDVVETIQRRTVLEVHKMLIDSTPVLTGTARASWIISQKTASAVTPKHDFYTYQEAQARQGEAKNIKPFTVTFITNNQPYIDALNDGHSAKADANFVEAAVAIAEAELEIFLARQTGIEL